jgi:hypothetical protein
MSIRLTDPTALADQVHAATTDARRILTDATRRAGVARLASTTTNPWLADQAATLRASLRAPDARSCTHLDDGPRVVYAAAWAPGILVCPSCISVSF